MLKVKNLNKYFGTERILNKISFNLEKGHKVALVGFNGVGKSTLLKIIADLEELDSGVIEILPNVKISFVPQDSVLYENKNVFDFIKEYTEQDNEEVERQTEIMFAGFGLISETKNKKIKELSSGQKTKVFLSAMLLKKADLLLLDEPTNNLDLPALIWLENYMQNISTACIIVSHDRKFLDSVTNKVYEIDWFERSLKVSNGKYTDFLNRTTKEIERQFFLNELQREEIERLRQTAEVKRQKAIDGSKWKGTDNDKMLIGFKRDRAGYSFKDSKVLYGRIKRMDIIEKPNVRDKLNLKIDPLLDGSSKDIYINDLICGYDDGFRVGPINLDLKFRKKVAILGLNGTGKSTILKTLLNIIPPISGKIEIGNGVKIGNLMQEHESLPKLESVNSFLKKRTKLEEEIIFNTLKHFGFTEWQMKNKIKHLSPGGRARLLLAYFILINVNVLVLDEPTNHLDVDAQIALENSLKEFTGTILMVTHDRYFVQNSNLDYLYVLEDGILNQVSNFESYVENMTQKSRKLIRLLK
jgi:ATP-binding cassette, subfamily F, member 3